MRLNNTPHHARQPRRGRQRGASLMEVLVSLLILGFGLLGMSALQSRALKGNVSSFQRSQAVVFSQYMMDVMRADRELARKGFYNIPKTCSTKDLTGVTLARNTQRDWLQVVQSNLGPPGDPGTCVAAQCDGSYLCTVKIFWDDSRAGGLSDQSVEINSRV